MAIEIKFRIWTPATKTMHYDRPSFVADYFNRQASIKVAIDDVQLMQFIGLLDKNGKEIYEGDIIKMSGGLRLKHYPDSGPITFSEYSASFIMKGIRKDGDYMNISLGCSDGTEFEVIGNIHENPNPYK